MVRRSRSGSASGALLPVLTALVAVLFVSCGPPETDPDALRGDDGTALYRDGTYAAAYSHTGPDGWRPFLQLQVRAGLIDKVCFDAVNAAGARLTDSEGFVESYRLRTGVTLPGLFNDLSVEALRTQRGPVDAGAETLAWRTYFEVLLETALASAEVGVTVDAAGIDSVPLAGPYRAIDRPDELGWHGELVVTYNADGIAAASYREIRQQPDGSLLVQSDDAAYQNDFAAMSGTTSAEVADALTASLIANGAGSIDAVSGATLTSRRFAKLARSIDSARVVAPLPRRLCR